MNMGYMEEMYLLQAKTKNDYESIQALKVILEGYCFSGDFKGARDFLHRVDGIFDMNYDSGYLISAAAMKNDMDFMKFLFANGADIGCCCNESPLLLADYHNNQEMVKYLVDQGADPKVLSPSVANPQQEEI